MGDSACMYQIKDITLFGSPRRILLQSTNGPCPLLAACNTLLLRSQLALPPSAEYVSFETLTQSLINLMLDVNDKERDEVRVANIQQCLEACIELLPTLNVGLDVNCRFSGPRDFEYTSALSVFDLLDISIVHGWVVAPEEREACRVLSSHSYNSAMEILVRCEEAQQQLSSENSGVGSSSSTDLPAPKSRDLGSLLEESEVVRAFLDNSASQLTYEGLISLLGTLRNREIAVFFRNNHFGTMLKHDDCLYLLCTDVGFLENEAVWERLDAIDGDTAYLCADFCPPGAGNVVATLKGESSSAAMATDWPQLSGTLQPPDAASQRWGMQLSASASAAELGAAAASDGPVRALCPGCSLLNDFPIRGEQSKVQCGSCRKQFVVKRPSVLPASRMWAC